MAAAHSRREPALPLESPLGEPPVYREPYVFSFRRPAQSFLARFVAHVL